MLTLLSDIVLMTEADWIIGYCLVHLANLKIPQEALLFGITRSMWHK